MGVDGGDLRSVLGRGPVNDEVAAENRHSTLGRRETTRERIVQAAAETFAEGGYNGVNLNDVLVGLSLTKGALYYSFPTKDSLVQEVVRRHFETFEEVSRAVVAESTSRLDAIVTATYRVAELFRSNAITRAGARLSMERNVVKGDVGRPFVGWVDRIVRLLKQAKARGEIRNDVNPRETAELVVGFFVGALALANGSDDLTKLPVLLDRFWEVVLPSIRPQV